MKCPKCGAEISLESTVCPKCGIHIVEKELAHANSKPKPPKEWKALILYTLRSKWFVLGVVLLLMGEAAALIIFSPEFSPFGRIRDNDRDGVPNGSDPAPDDPSVWRWASGDIILTLHNPSGYNDAHYRVFINANLEEQGDLAHTQTTILTIPVSFLVGKINNYTVSMTITIDGSSWYYGAVATLLDGQNYPLAVDFNYD